MLKLKTGKAISMTVELASDQIAACDTSCNIIVPSGKPLHPTPSFKLLWSLSSVDDHGHPGGALSVYHPLLMCHGVKVLGLL